ncbi:MAG: response regulator [Deltaproteobacteria bacterium]|nr:response regulator [Deltaproteobacteria bacterium]
MPKNKKILIADDDRENLSVLERFLFHSGFKADLAENGAEAFERFRRNDYAMIFSDINMPGMTGIELLRKIRAEDDNTPVIMITGFPTITLAVDAIKQGADDFITKPVSLVHIEHIIRRIEKEENLRLENRRLNRKLQNKQEIEELNRKLELKVEELSIMYSISEIAHHSDDMETLFDKLVEMTKVITKAREISILLLDRDTNRLIPKRVHGMETNVPEIPIGEGLVGRVAQDKRSLVVPADLLETVAIPHASRGPFLSLPMMVKNELFGVLNISKPRSGSAFTDKELHLLQSMITKCVLALENHALYESLYDNLIDTLRSLVMAVEAKDLYTRDHSRRVTDLSILVARYMGRPRSEMETLRFAGFIHDIGKIGIQDTVLLKPGRLNDKEASIIKTHPVIGENIVKPLKFLKLEQAIVRHHHERFDGTGYPDGLSGTEIPVPARILSVADTYDAITSTRPYRTARGHNFAVAEIQRCRKSQFDPEVSEAFLECLRKYGNRKVNPGIRWDIIRQEARNVS